MVQQVTGRSVPERGLPLDVGCVVDNVGTLLNIQDALEGTPVTEKYLSVVGEVKEPILLKVPVGTALTACVAEARPNLADYALIVGGPMMGKPLTDRAAIEAAVVTKTTGNLIVLPKEHYLFRRAQLPMETIRHQTKSACIQCRMCTDLCPRYLIGHQIRPNLVMRNLWREGSIEDNEEYLRSFGDAANCCDCGVCEMFACPMGPGTWSPTPGSLWTSARRPPTGWWPGWACRPTTACTPTPASPWSRRRYSSRSSSTSASPPCLSRPWATRWQRESFWLRPPRTA